VALNQILMIAGRALLALLFVLAGIAKILGPAPFLAHMSEHRVPGPLLWGVIALELGCGLALLVGWRLPYTAGALAGFCVLTAAVFHNNLGNKTERTLFLKDLAIAGGLAVVAAGAM
jgi:putative oxidoreductase